MKTYAILSVVYFCVAVAVVLLTRDNGLLALYSAWQKASNIVEAFWVAVGFLICGGIVLRVVSKTDTHWTFVKTVLVAFGGTIFLQAGFTLMKTSLPFIAPFYADVALAEWDKALHGGVDPYVIVHALAEQLPMDLLIPFYLHVWVWPAICLPILIAAFDRDKDRVARTLILYGAAWVLIGNVMALAGMSAGPVFYDRIYETDRFAELTAAIAQTPQIRDYFGPIQDFLWSAYTTQDQSIGFGISAFPSVHLSMAMVTAVYLWDRSRLLGLIGVGFVAVILFLSVYSGYHYALDGYVSIAVIGGLWVFLRRRAAAPRQIMDQAAQLA
ncbi:phosphatase PAP2 family protein [Octadecabacter sp. 1_MG-2023]|uniref:phosphatase PAP2 family protein n=1 Tax=unclassified Octadecabacter TaxID=196158 RepID=UPI001C084F6F|nr:MULTISPECIES: phosphatase PAP2 family protein [unclassified Octadecabacter]MBU2994653.1 phosphatase PAP2 family protein [Octadecabacter sp. B2R22]MDO6734054.1 phosphatase PAP2 family protein [Octadecabacter sp. 1_MG-2023]